jgi:hypothetical protein
MNNLISYRATASNATGEPNWCEVQDAKTRIHEAAHAVIARVLGFEVAWVSVDTDFIRKDPIAIENMCSIGYPLCMTISSPILNPILNKRSALNKAEKESVSAYIMHVLAGPFAERRFDPDSFDAEASYNDYRQATAVLNHLGPRIAEPKKLLSTAQRNLNRALDAHASSIARVASALSLRKTLTGDDVDKIIGSIPSQLAA